MSKLGKIRFNDKCQRYYIDLSWQGKRHRLYKYLGYIPCENEALATLFLHDIRSEINKGIFNPERYRNRRPLHLGTYAEGWLEGLSVSEATLHDYQNSLNNHILPILGHEFLPDINYDKLRKLQTSIKRGPKGKYNVMGCLHKLLKDSHRSGHISQMPEFPGFRGTEAIVLPTINWIEDGDQRHIIDHIPIEDRHIFLFMKFTGCRPSEARAFRKVDIKKNYIKFEVTFGCGEILKEVKSKKTRIFPKIEALEEVFGLVPGNLTPFVFINSNTGRPYTKNINRIWNQACDKAGVKKVALYNSTRHSFGCQMLNAGFDKAVVQRLLGHSDPKMTDLYAEHSISSLKVALDRVIKFPVDSEFVNKVSTDGK